MIKTYKYRIYPNKDQQKRLQWTLDRCREVYNAALQERRDRYEFAVKRDPNYRDEAWRKQATKEHAISLYDQTNQLSSMKQIREEYKELSAAHILNDVCRRVDLAFKAFFKRCKEGKTPGYPRWKNYGRYDSFTYPDASGWEVRKGKLCLTRIGDIKIKLHRPVEGSIKTCTIKREGTQWYVTFSCECEEAPYPAIINDVVGIDLGIEKLATLSTGKMIENPRWYRRTEKKLQAAQQELSRKKKAKGKPKGKKPTRRIQAIQRLAKLHRKARRQRQDFLQKQSRYLVDTYETLVFEDLQIANLLKRPKPKQDAETGEYLPNGASAKAGLNKSISDAGWGMFVQYCACKAEWAGRTLLYVNPRYTSQTCSSCGIVRKKTLDERWHKCECGCSLDRDHNAALNIRSLGIQECERRGGHTMTRTLSQQTNEAGLALAFVASSPLKKRKRQRAAEPSCTPTLSQAAIWNGS